MLSPKLKLLERTSLFTWVEGETQQLWLRLRKVFIIIITIIIIISSNYYSLLLLVLLIIIIVFLYKKAAIKKAPISYNKGFITDAQF